MDADVKIEMRSRKTKVWRDTTLENFYELLKVTRSILRERQKFLHGNDKSLEDTIDQYSEKRAIWSIVTGHIIYTPIFDFRLAEGMACPMCDSKFVEAYGALSRRDNKTRICSSCGVLETHEDMKEVGK